VALLKSETQEAGKHEVSFSATGLQSGVYTATLFVTARGGERSVSSVQLIVSR
jgi:hypothetical protein